MKIIIAGSTGRLGVKALNVIDKLKKQGVNIEIVGLIANTRKEDLEKQAQTFSVPKNNVILASKTGERTIENLINSDAEIVINVVSGVSGVKITEHALRAGKKLLLGNKESIVIRKEGFTELEKELVFPLDSEHNAIFEIIKNNPQKEVEKMIIPCSGGVFLGKKRSELKDVSVEQALVHPSWDMGAKISIESATLINKGLELIEAHILFDIPLEKIEPAIHPQCLIHGIVKFKNGEYHQYESAPNMEEHIKNGLLRALGLNTDTERKIKRLKEVEVIAPDHDTFEGIRLVLEAFERGGMEEFLNKEEEVINRFLTGEVGFLEIFDLLKH